MMARPLLLVSAALMAAFAGALVGVFVLLHSTSAEVGQLRGQLAGARSSQAALKGEIGSLVTSYAQLSTTVASLSAPNDPLSAYTDICDVYLTNSTTDVSQEYYYPCTNSAETIPRPGS